MPLITNTVFFFTLLSALCSASGTTEVYLYPPLSFPIESVSLGQGTALLAHHLGLVLEVTPQKDQSGELVLGTAKPFVGEGVKDTLLVSVNTSHPEDVVPTSLNPSFDISAPLQLISTIFSPYMQLADDPPSPYVSWGHPSGLLDVLSLSATSSSKPFAFQQFLDSLSALVAFLEETRERDPTGRFGVFQVRGLEEIEEEWGRQSDQYLTATETLKATVQSALSSPLTLSVIVSSSALRARQILQPPQSSLPSPGIPDTAPIFSTSTCFTTEGACVNATGGCSSRGQCAAVTRAGRTCYVCECRRAPIEEGGRNFSWAGSMCQKKDLSQQFTLIAGTVLFLVTVAFGSIALLYTIGSQELPGTLTGGVGGHAKLE